MPNRLAIPLLALVPILLAACGGNANEAATTPTTVGVTTGEQAVPVSPPPTRVVVYFYRAGKLSPVARRVPHTEAVATAALHALADGPPDGYETALPDDAELRVTGIADGHATLDVRADLDERANAQVVYTLTRFPTISDVRYRGMIDPATGAATEQGLGRTAFVDLASPIIIESPLPHDQVPTPVRVRGTARVYEATLVVELVQEGKVLVKKTVTASTGAPETGTFDTTLAGGTAGAAQIVAFSPSAADGSEQHRVEVPVQITP